MSSVWKLFLKVPEVFEGVSACDFRFGRPYMLWNGGSREYHSLLYGWCAVCTLVRVTLHNGHNPMTDSTGDHVQLKVNRLEYNRITVGEHVVKTWQYA